MRRINVPDGLLVRMAARCSSGCSRDAVDRRRHPGRGETPRRGEQRGYWTTWTRRVCVDGGRFTHNPEVAGSNPAPATKFAGQRPLPIMEGAFCMCRVHGIVHEASEEGRRGGWAVRRTPRTSFATPPVYNLHSGAAPVNLR